MELWIRAHLETEHPWDVALYMEAYQLQMQGDLRELLDQIRWKVMFGFLLDSKPVHYKGLRGILNI